MSEKSKPANNETNPSAQLNEPTGWESLAAMPDYDQRNAVAEFNQEDDIESQLQSAEKICDNLFSKMNTDQRHYNHEEYLQQLDECITLSQDPQIRQAIDVIYNESEKDNYDNTEQLLQELSSDCVITALEAEYNEGDGQHGAEITSKTKEIFRNLGAIFPFTDTTEDPFYRSNSDYETILDDLEQNGFITEKYREAVYQKRLENLFGNNPIPERILHPASETKEYWKRESKQANCDTLGIFLKSFIKDDIFSQDKKVNYDTLDSCLDSQGMPTMQAFATDSPVVKHCIGQVSGKAGDFLANHFAELEDPAARFFVANRQAFPIAKRKEFGNYDSFCRSMYRQEYFNSDSTPNDNFWDQALLSNNPMIIRELARISNHDYSENQQAFLSLSAKDALKNHYSKISQELNYCFNIVHSTGYESIGDFVNHAITPEGRLSQDFLRGLDLTTDSLIEFVQKFPEDIANLPSSSLQAYLNSSEDDREQTRKTILDELRTKIRTDQNIDDHEKHRQEKLLPLVNNSAKSQILNQVMRRYYANEMRISPETIWNFMQGNIESLSKNQSLNREALSVEQRKLLETYEKLNPDGSAFNILQHSCRNMLAGQDINDYAGKDLKSLLTQKLFQDSEFELLNTDDKFPFDQKQYLTDIQKTLLTIYDSIPAESKNARRVLREFARTSQFDNLSVEQIQHLGALAQKTVTSNAIEVRRANGDILKQILEQDSPDQKLESIEQIFLKNNLPYVGKVFRTFQILHPAERDFGNISRVMNRGVLENLPDTGFHSKEAVLFNDLIKANIDSNSRSMREWIKKIREDNSEYLHAAYNQTRQGSHNPLEGQVDSSELANHLGVNDRYSAGDRIVRSFGYQLGLKSLNDLEQRMDNRVNKAHAKGINRYNNHDFSIETGDLVKAVNLEYLNSMFNNGIVSKEFLNGEASSDSTPLDADLTRIMEEANIDGSISSGIDWKNQHASFGTMKVNLVMKGDDRFITEANEKSTGYDPEKFTLWNNGGSDHGIRVGLPSTAIDFITFDSSRALENDKNFLCQEIAKNGFYIPVINQHTGEPIFSPEDFQKLRQKLSGLEYYNAGNYQFAHDDDLVTPEITEITQNLTEHNTQIEQQRATINNELESILAEIYPDFQGLKKSVDGDLTSGFVELIDTGSTGRGTSIPGSNIDFDFIMRIDGPIYNNAQRRNEVIDLLKQHLSYSADKSTNNGLRLKEVTIPGISEPLDLDISLVQRTNRMEFSTDQAVRERLDAIAKQDPVRHQLVIANIIKAKELLKSANAYKPKTSSDTIDANRKGGIGGVGIENWILQNGGSLKVAAEDFLRAVDEVQGDFEQFKAIYPIWDAGQNHFSVRDNEQSAEQVGGSNTYKIPFDNFVTRNMDDGGFSRMTTALREYLTQV